ncbi:hypothetical protein M408DRAFT_331632 [Serendipita vermifera MAFF 305830]|uniref:F-box domain-containing protein n=1 Tax=Serendipita vermifera MAFF 305830 TaxID=933852 RepID=A0A0C2WDZ1_SERVB|nr:hypothetical protein M408DRAFT_331632 [Serendipita vermifera MAFF 305830]
MPTNNRISTSPVRGRYFKPRSQYHESIILKLPIELLLGLFQYLDYSSLLALSLTCQFLSQVMKEQGWRDFVRANYRHTASVQERWSFLSWKQRARDAERINQAWSSHHFTAKTLNTPWPQKFHSVLALSAKRLVVAAGNAITSYRFGFDTNRGSSIVFKEGTYTIFPSAHGFDITGIEFLPDGGKDETLLVSNHSGSLVRIQLPTPHRGQPTFQAKRTAQYVTGSNTIRILKVTGTMGVAFSVDGKASVVNTASPWIPPATAIVGKKAWSAYIETGSSSPYIAVGTDEHVAVHSFTNGLLSAEPSAVLGGPGRPTPVYCVGEFIPGGNPNIVASGWYDGKVRVHDLRSSQRDWLSESSTPSKKRTTLAPVMTFSDPWRSFDPIYSLAVRGRMEDKNDSSGGNGMPHQHHFLTAGSALHSVVCLWDVRSPSRSWSVYAPGGDRSPVYSLKAEGSRIWGATQWRAFVLDFAPDAPKTSFPFVQDNAAMKEPPTYVHFPQASVVG